MRTNSIFIAHVAEATGDLARFLTPSPDRRPNRRVFRFHATETAQLQVTSVLLMTAVHVTRALRLRR